MPLPRRIMEILNLILIIAPAILLVLLFRARKEMSVGNWAFCVLGALFLIIIRLGMILGVLEQILNK